MWRYRRHRMFQWFLTAVFGLLWGIQTLHAGFDPFVAAQTIATWVWLWEP